MKQFYDMINKRLEQYIPVDKPFKEVYPDYTDWCVLWYKEAEKLSNEFAAEGLPETAHAVKKLIRDNLASAVHNSDRHLILPRLAGDYSV